jgi:hypothetical protein
MPRIVFDVHVKSTYFKWVDRFCKDGKYTAYFTKAGECVLEPTRSTSPIRYAYISRLLPEDVGEITKKCEELGIPYFYITAYEWTSDRSVGVDVTRY